MLNIKRLGTGLFLSGLICAVPAFAQSALAQQSAQGSKTPTANSSTAKPAAKPATSKSTAKPAATTAKKSPPRPLVYIQDNRSNKTADASKAPNASTARAVDASAKKSSDASPNPKP